MNRNARAVDGKESKQIKFRGLVPAALNYWLGTLCPEKIVF